MKIGAGCPARGSLFNESNKQGNAVLGVGRCNLSPVFYRFGNYLQIGGID